MDKKQKDSSYSEWLCDESSLKPMLEHVAQVLLNTEKPFVLWLEGQMGAGKTSFVRHLLHSLGLPSEHPVVSPTYTLVNEYRIDSYWYAHLDLYRAEENFSFEELGIQDVRDHIGFFIEWPRVGQAEDFLPPTHQLTITLDENGKARLYQFKSLLR